MPIFNKCCWA